MVSLSSVSVFELDRVRSVEQEDNLICVDYQGRKLVKYREEKLKVHANRLTSVW
jgi:hypothetical protein